jgi:hypothetical protein
MAEVEMLFSARHLSDELGITLQMLSKYAQAYTKLTKRQIKKQGRDGRHFTSEQREVIKNARDMVRTQTGMTVDEAMKRALVFDSAALEVESWGDTTGFDLDRLKQALNESVTLPLVAEIKALRIEVQELRESGQTNKPAAKKNKSIENKQHSPLIRLLIRFESLLRRFGQSQDGKP